MLARKTSIKKLQYIHASSWAILFFIATSLAQHGGMHWGYSGCLTHCSSKNGPSLRRWHLSSHNGLLVALAYLAQPEATLFHCNIWTPRNYIIIIQKPLRCKNHQETFAPSHRVFISVSVAVSAILSLAYVSNFNNIFFGLPGQYLYIDRQYMSISYT